MNRRVNMDNKGQGAIEYLLIIAAAILVVAIVILALTGALGSGQDQAGQSVTDQNAQQNVLKCNFDCNSLDNNCAKSGSCAIVAPDFCKAGSSPSYTCQPN